MKIGDIVTVIGLRENGKIKLITDHAILVVMRDGMKILVPHEHVTKCEN